MKQEDIWALQLVHLFLTKYNYRIVTIANKTTKDDLWLVNAKSRYPVIRISTLSIASSNEDWQQMMTIHKAVLDLLRVQAELVSIHLSDEIVAKETSGVVEVCMSPDYISSHVLNREFPELPTFLKPITDPKKEYDDLSKSINKIQLDEIEKKKNVLEKNGRVTYSVMAICVAVWLATLWLTAKTQDKIVSAILCGAFYKTFVYGASEYFRLLTCGFVHVDFLHLVCNLYALYNIGPTVELLFGRRKYFWALLGSILIASMFVMVGNENTVTLGISGGVFGLLGMLLVYSIDTKTIRNRGVYMTFLQILGINFLISLLPGISFLGHVGGFIGGLFFGLIFSENREWRSLRKNAAIAFVIMLMSLTYMAATDRNRGPLYGETDQRVIQTLNQLGLNSYGDYLDKSLSRYYRAVGESK